MKFALLFFLVAGLSAAGELNLGKPLALKKSTPIPDILAKPDRFVGKTLQVRGKVTEVCQMMGCWMALVDPQTQASIRVKVNDGEIIFPKDSIGKLAVAEGKLVKLELTRDQALARAKHEAEEQGRAFDPDSVTGGATIYQLRGTGAVIQP